MKRLTALSIGVTSALVFAGAGAPKEGARAELTTRLLLGAAPQSRLAVEWAVDVPAEDGRRPFDAIGMFVRLLDRSGGPATTAYATSTAHPDGRYATMVTVPRGGIGGIRVGLRGTTEIFFPILNDPFRSPSGTLCDVTALRRALGLFVRAYNGGQLAALDRLFSRNRFVWYSAGAPEPRLGGDATDRATLVGYFERRHRHADRLKLLSYKFNSYDRARDLGHFEFRALRSARDYRGERPFDASGKGALDCRSSAPRIAVLSLGGPVR